MNLHEFWIGTTNPSKIREIAAIISPLQIKLSVTDPLDPPETASTFEGNAAIKAQVYGQHVGARLRAQLMAEHPEVNEEQARAFLRLQGIWTISEDSGLAVAHLKGLPGPWSARFSDYARVDLEQGQLHEYTPTSRSREEIDTANNARVLELLRGVEMPYRAAEFVTALIIANTDGEIVHQCFGRAAGWIVDSPRGNHGFGYDPIFASSTSFGRTWAEIDPVRKNLHSHRRHALDDFTAWLATVLKHHS